jgi:hypothetical protein
LDKSEGRIRTGNRFEIKNLVSCGSLSGSSSA